MSKPVVQFKFIGGAGFIRIGHRARIMVLDHLKSPIKGEWDVARTSPVIQIDRGGGTFETRNTIYKLWDEQSSPSFTWEITPFQFKWHNPLEGKLPSYNETVLLVVRGMYAVGELCRETGSYEDSYTSYDYWMDSDESQNWEWEDVTAWAKLPPLPQWV